jgi:hypothetical protein
MTTVQRLSVPPSNKHVYIATSGSPKRFYQWFIPVLEVRIKQTKGTQSVVCLLTKFLRVDVFPKINQSPTFPDQLKICVLWEAFELRTATCCLLVSALKNHTTRRRISILIVELYSPRNLNHNVILLTLITSRWS